MKKTLILFLAFVLVSCRIEANQDLSIDANLHDKYHIGKERGIIAIQTDNSYSVFDRSDIESKTGFDITLETDSNNIYTLKCRLWL